MKDKRYTTHTVVVLIEFLIITILFVSRTNAGSIYSSKGIGLWRNYVSAQGAGMGGIGISLMDNLNINLVNPAARYPAQLTRISCDFDFIMTNAQADAGSATTDEAMAVGLRILIPITNRISFSTGFHQASAVNYVLTSTGTLNEQSYERNVTGKGGLNKAEVSLFFAPLNFLFLGISGNYYFGRVEETWNVEFASGDFVKIADKFSTHMNGANATAGIIVRPIKNWNVGAIFSTKRNLKSKIEILQSYNTSVNYYEDTFKLPFMWGVGTTYEMNNRFTVGADYQSQSWKNVESTVSTTWKYRNSHYLAMGAQFKPSNKPNDDYFKRVAYRVGFRIQDLQFNDTEGDKIREMVGTVGFSLPFFIGFGRIDVALEYGRRGSLETNPVEETFGRLLVTVVGSERWFQRRN